MIQAAIKLLPVPLRYRNLVLAGCEAIPDVFDELETLGNRQPQDLVEKGVGSHECNVGRWLRTRKKDVCRPNGSRLSCAA